MSWSDSAVRRVFCGSLARTGVLFLAAASSFACAGDVIGGEGTNSTVISTHSSAGSGGSAGAQAGGAGTSSAGASSAGQAGAAATNNGGQAGSAAAGGSGGASSASGGSSGASGSAGTGSAGGGGSVSHVPRLGTALKILPFGDSITASTCYRARLAVLLDAGHSGDYDFLGSQSGDFGCGSTYDMDHEGHGGYLITQHSGDFAGWASANPTDVVLLHFATNDVWNAVPTDNILAAYGQAVDEFRKNNANVTILVAKLIPFAPDGCDHCDVSPLNAAIPGWAASKATTTSPIVVVDQFTGYDASGDNRDQVHPNDSGSQKLADHWAAALEALF